jgi:hypothetical protein
VELPDDYRLVFEAIRFGLKKIIDHRKILYGAYKIQIVQIEGAKG